MEARRRPPVVLTEGLDAARLAAAAHPRYISELADFRGESVRCFTTTAGAGSGSRSRIPGSIVQRCTRPTRSSSVRTIGVFSARRCSRPRVCVVADTNGGSCDERLKLSSSSTAAERILARPRRGLAERKRCGGGSVSPEMPNATPRSRLWPASRTTVSPNAWSHGMPHCSSAARRLRSPLKPGGSAGNRPAASELVPRHLAP